MTFLNFKDLIRSKYEPNFKNLKVNPANGPNKSIFLPSTILKSRCGAVIDGVFSRAKL